MHKELLDALLTFAPWQDCLEGASKPGQVTALYDVTPSQRAFLAAALARHTGRQVLYLAPSQQAALSAAEDAAPWLDGAAALLPADELVFMRAVTARESSWQRLKVLGRARAGEIRMLSLSAEAILTRYMPAHILDSAQFTLKLGDIIEPLQVVDRLTQMGYERVSMVEGKGQCALLGDILNVFPPELDQPARIEFFDNEIDSIRSFDILSQISQERMDRIHLSPAEEYFLPEDQREKAAERMLSAIDSAPQSLDIRQKEAMLRDRDRLLETGSFPGMAQWVSVLLPQAQPLSDLFPDALVVIDSPERSLDRMEERQLGLAEDLSLALARGDALPAQQDLLLPPDQAIQALRQRPVITMQELLRGMKGLTPDNLIQLKGEGLSRLRGRFSELSEEIRGWRQAGYQVAILCGGEARAQRMQRSLQAFDMALPIKEPGGKPIGPGDAALIDLSFSRGFVMAQAKLCLLCDSDVFGSSQRRARARKKAGERIEAFTDLSVGDYVVHEHHGIGIYQGTVRIQSEGTWRDYLFIQYQGNDKLYVPLDQFDRVQKYIGAGDDPPKLNDLASGDWQKQYKKVRSGVQKLAFDLVALYAARQAEPGFAFPPQPAFEHQFNDQFEFELTHDQQQAVGEVLRDMESPHNMDRLLCGDVGYGKTEVALRAAFRAVINNKQVALLAPTTILVQQHYHTMLKRFQGFPVNIGFVSRFRSAKENKETIAKAKRGEIDILVGTHRLLSKDVAIKDLGLLIVDEEQRFGVAHKETIKNIKRRVDVLTLSATPIPRTLHMSMLGVRDLSLLENPPEERFPVQTYVIDYSDALIRDAILRETGRGGQVFFLYNRVADIDRFASRLRQLVPEVRVAVAHGQMPEGQLEDVMMDFYEGRYDLLLCTTIIENGIDIQRANTLIVYEANNFGLSQLYQLRGRVGRGNQVAYAYFTVRPDRLLTETAEKRLAAIKEFTEFGSGFRIAMRDLSIRGAGNILGPEQSGQVSAVGYDLYCKIIEEAVREAKGDFSGQRESEMETRVELHVNAYLPDSFVPGEAQRMEIYKRIASIRSAEERSQLMDELIDRFGEPEKPVITLMDVALLRAMANQLGADFVSFSGDALKLRLNAKYVVDPSLLYQAMIEVDSRLTLQSGKKPSLLLVLPGADQAKALKEGLIVLEKLLRAIDRMQQSA